MARLVDSGMPGNADSGFRHPTNRTSAQNDESGCAHAGTTDEALLWKATQELRSGPANATRQTLVTSCTDAAIKDDRKNPGRGRGIRTPDRLLPTQMRYQTAPCPAQQSRTRHVVSKTDFVTSSWSYDHRRRSRAKNLRLLGMPLLSRQRAPTFRTDDFFMRRATSVSSAKSSNRAETNYLQVAPAYPA